MKLFLDETRHPEISNYINYKIIGPGMRELQIFEVTSWILPSVLTSMGCEGHNSPYTTSNWVQLILLRRWRIEYYAIEISYLDLNCAAPVIFLIWPKALLRWNEAVPFSPIWDPIT